MFRKAIDSQFKPHWLSYVLQSSLATLSVFVAVLALRQQNLVVAASLAATAFTVFAIPSSITSSPRNVIGGHLIGLLFGSVFALISHPTAMSQDILFALAVGCSMFVMTITNTEHPPAAGTALGIVIAGYSKRVVFGVLIGVLILTALHRLLRPLLRDLIARPER